MNDEQVQLGERIAAARQAAELTQTDLGERIDRSKSVVCRIEQGQRAVSSFELGQIADAVGRSVLYLLGEPVEERPRLALAARLAEAGEQDQLDRALKRVRTLLEVEDLMEQLGGLDPLRAEDPPDLELPSAGSAARQGERAASQVREALQLGAAPISDLPGLLEERFAVDVMLEPLPETVAGLCIDLGGRSLLVVDSGAVVGRQRFSLAHELCHHLWREASFEDPLIIDRAGSNKQPAEKRADAFAATLLMPKAGLRQAIAGRQLTDELVVTLMFAFQVSLQALTYRLLFLGLIDQDQCNRLQEAGPRRLARRAGRSQDLKQLERERGLVRPPERLEQAVVRAYEKGQIGIGPVADLFAASDREQLRQELAEDGIQPAFDADLAAFLDTGS